MTMHLDGRQQHEERSKERGFSVLRVSEFAIEYGHDVLALRNVLAPKKDTEEHGEKDEGEEVRGEETEALHRLLDSGDEDRDVILEMRHNSDLVAFLAASITDDSMLIEHLRIAEGLEESAAVENLFEQLYLEAQEKGVHTIRVQVPQAEDDLIDALLRNDMYESERSDEVVTLTMGVK